MEEKIDYQTIEENINKYIQREGKPFLYKGKKIILRRGIFDIEIQERLPSIDFILNNCEIAEEIYQDAYTFATRGYVDPYELIRTNLLEKGGLLNKFMVTTTDWITPRKHNPLKKLIYEMAVREQNKKETYFIDGIPHPKHFHAVEWNVMYQPSLRNSFTFRNYFRLKEKTNKDIYSDKKLKDLLEGIPLDFRDFKIEDYINKEIKSWESELKHLLYPLPVDISIFSSG